MDKQKNSGNRIVWAIALLVIPLWFISFPQTTFQHNIKPLFIYTSQVSALLGFALYAVALILATRLRLIEDLFGGLDKVYHAHHTAGKAAFTFLLVHPLLIALRWVPQNISKAAEYLFPLHRRIAVDLGSWAWWGLILLMLVTLAIKLPYDKWKIAHKLMGLFFALAILHIFLLDGNIVHNPWLAGYVSLLSVAGMSAYVYKIIVFDIATKKRHARVEQVKRLDDRVIEISLSTGDEKLAFVPGQFCFFSFRAANLSRESHPFTICSAPGEENISIIVKSLGDYTELLHRHLAPGATALLEGPYGRFNYKLGRQAQVWIGGGVGIAPFISWIRDLQKHPWPGLSADLYYCVDSAAQATHVQEFCDFAEQQPRFGFHLICADERGYLTADSIPGFRNKEIYICGPKEMRTSLLVAMEVGKGSIHFEDFDFF